MAVLYICIRVKKKLCMEIVYLMVCIRFLLRMDVIVIIAMIVFGIIRGHHKRMI